MAVRNAVARKRHGQNTWARLKNSIRVEYCDYIGETSVGISAAKIRTSTIGVGARKDAAEIDGSSGMIPPDRSRPGSRDRARLPDRVALGWVWVVNTSPGGDRGTIG